MAQPATPVSAQPLDLPPDVLALAKLRPPLARANLVPRARLEQRLAASLTVPLMLVAAPPGYGKTTLLSNWLARNQVAVGWVALDEHDNETVRFWKYVSAAVHMAQPNLDRSP